MKLVACLNVYNDNAALPGALENAKTWADDIFVIHAGPNGKLSTDGTIETLEKSGVRFIFDDISKGFGAIRTLLIQLSKGDWCIIMDADERIWSNPPVLIPAGTQFYPDTMKPDISITAGAPYDQHAKLRSLIEQADKEECLAVCLSRRHWFDAPGTFKTSCQNWTIREDWQLRCVKNSVFSCYDPHVRIHERLLDSRTWSEPKYIRGNAITGPFFDHYSLHFKAKAAKKNAEDAATYESLEAGCVEKMWLGTFDGAKKE